MVERLYNRGQYPAGMALEIETMGQLTVSVANRWAMGWPDRVQELLKQRAFLPALINQVEAERTLLAEEPNLRHLTPREIREMFEIREEPPLPAPTEI